jgi:hypothetical protein
MKTEIEIKLREEKYTFTEFMKKFFPDYIIQKKEEFSDLCDGCDPVENPLCDRCVGV